jgi:hypothetical protein
MEEEKELSIKEWREQLVDYTDNTPNEPRYIKKDILDDTIYYPLGNIYYNKYNKQLIRLPLYCSNDTAIIKKELFENKLNYDRITYAIKFLQVDALKKYIIKNYKSVLLPNPFAELYYTVYLISENLEATKEVIKILINNYDVSLSINY